uniref:Alkene monooxygenase coupling protein n=1 Tax=Rhodococcus ruber TaxID=1830 RepID=A0A866W2C7_9NOCA|nr:alkene monooxygenase coupling protein [Rhodococcus ruber]
MTSTPSAAVPGTKNRRVGISLISSSDTEAAVEHIAETQPDAKIDFRDCFYKIERDGQLSFDMAELSEIAGRDIDTDIFLVNMSTYYGRIVVSDGRVDIYAEIQPARFKD